MEYLLSLRKGDIFNMKVYTHKKMIKQPLILLLFFFLFKSVSAQQLVVYFDDNSYELTHATKTALDKISQLSIDSIKLVGHCDNRGNEALNIELSKNRTQAVEEYLLKESPHLTTVLEWKGFKEPKATNDTEKGMQLNRRVALFFSEKKPTTVEAKKETEIKPVAKQPARPVNTYKCQVVDRKGEFIKQGIFQTFDQEHQLVNESVFENGRFNVIDSGQVTQVRVDSKNYFSQIINERQVQGYCIVQLQEIKKNSYFTFQHLGFVPNDSTILYSSYPELEGLLKTMKENPKLNIHIEGHTNGVNTTQSPEWHELISKGRANAVYNYLLINGINRDRLSYEGYGCKKMVYPNAINQLEAQKNRRVEIKVISF